MKLYQKFIAWVRDEDSPGFDQVKSSDTQPQKAMTDSKAESFENPARKMGEISGTISPADPDSQGRDHDPHHFGKIVFPIDEITAAEKPHLEKQEPLFAKHSVFYIRFFSVLFTLAIAVILLVMVADSPVSGTREDNPTLNEVSQRYVENGVEETGVVNFVAGIILDYRAFDTFGEAAMVFTSAIGVIILLHDGEKSGMNKGKAKLKEKEKGEKQHVSLSRR